MNKNRWLNLMAQLGLPPSLEVYQQLWSVYQQPHRYYHTSQHINHCLQQLDQALSLAQAPAEVELALWFHDAVYQPKASDNEAKSAAWAVTFLKAVSDSEAYQDLSERIYCHIMATQHHRTALIDDMALVVDIDLSILGQEADIFAQFETNIRKEYHWVPESRYRQKRCDILSSFLARSTVYETEYFQDHYEMMARKNLIWAVDRLKD